MTSLRSLLALLPLACLLLAPAEGTALRQRTRQRARQHLGSRRSPAVSSAPGNGTASALPASLAILADRCRCRFVGLCSCDAALEFMNCVTDACGSGQCDCGEEQFVTHCHSMDAVCPSVGLACSKGQATCEHKPILIKESKAELREGLAQLKERKCRLERAVKDGYLNADNRLRELEPLIQAKLDALEAKGVKKKDLPYMGCGPHPEVLRTAAPAERTSPPTKPQGSGGRSGGEEAFGEEAADAGREALRTTEGPEKRLGTGATLGAFAAWIVLLLVCAFLYNRHRMSPLVSSHPDANPHLSGKTGFRHGLFACLQDVRLSLFACCCPALRWADTLDKAQSRSSAEGSGSEEAGGTLRFLQYWHAIALVVVLAGLHHLLQHVPQLGRLADLLGLVLLFLAVMYRQRLRTKYGMEAHTPKTYCEDCLAWFCCSCCAIVQEARQVDADVTRA